MLDFKVGQTIETLAHQQGLVKYIGPIHVAEGTWLGIELPTPDGKNDGSVRGQRYFNCPLMHGLFVKDVSIAKIVSTPVAAPGQKSPQKPKSSSLKPRPSSGVAPKPTPRLTTFPKRQSVAPPTTVRAPVRKASTAGTPATSSTTPSSAATTTRTIPRDSNVDALQTKLRHLEKQHTEDQERIKDLVQARDERDRFHGIIQKLQSKCQSLHQDLADQKNSIQQLQADNDRLSRADQEHEIDMEDALVEKEMAQERAEQAEVELDMLRSKLEERDLEVEVLREEAELFNTDMSAEDKEDAGYYRLQHENERLREALIALKEMTSDQEHVLKSQIKELERDVAQIDSLRAENTALKEETTAAAAILEHLHAQLDAGSEWEEMANELTARNHMLEDRNASLELIVQDLDNLRELNDELEIQHAEQEEEMRADLVAKDTELAEQHARIESQTAVIADQETLIEKFRELVLDLQGKMQDAESSRSLTQDEVNNTTARFNEVMEMNRRLRASNVQAVGRQITSEMNRITGDEATEMLAICTQIGSTDFVNSTPMRTYFTSKRISAKSALVSSLLSSVDKHTTYSNRLDESSSQLLCVEATFHLTVIGSGSDRLRSTMSSSTLPQFASFGSTYSELSIVEQSLDSGLEALRTDSVNFSELTKALRGAWGTLEAVLDTHADALESRPEDIILDRIQNITTSLTCLRSNFAVVHTLLGVLADSGVETARDVLDKFAEPSAICHGALQSAQKLLNTTLSLRSDALFPHIFGGTHATIEVQAQLHKLAFDASEWVQNAMRTVSSYFDVDGSLSVTDMAKDVQLHDLLLFYWGSDIFLLQDTTTRMTAWIEDMSVLVNCSEITHFPTPWAQKAKEVELARKQRADASALLDSLTAEHKATLLSLHERERALETKDLEIEHLGARYRDVTQKMDEQQRLREQISAAGSRISLLEREIHDQRHTIAMLEARSVQADEQQENRQVEDNPHRLVDLPASTLAVQPGEKCMMDALQNENHWLRLREHDNLFLRSLEDMTTLAYKRAQAEDPFSVQQYYESVSTLIEDDDNMYYHTAANTQNFEKAGRIEVSPAVLRLKMPPVVLDNVRTGWHPEASGLFIDDTIEFEALSEREWP